MTDALAVLQGRLPAQVAQVLSTRPSWLRPHLLIMAVVFAGALGVGYLLLPDDNERIAMLERDGHDRQALEILEQVPGLEAVVCPVGGAGLLAGISVAIKALRPEVRVIGVEAEATSSFQAALAAGKPVRFPTRPTLADGLAVSIVGENAFALARNRVDRIVTVGEDDLALAILRVLELEKGVVEGAAASPLAAFLAGELSELAGRKTALLFCGGNIDPGILSRVIEKGLVADGRLCRFTVTISDRPGGLAKLAAAIAATGAGVRDITHDRAFAGPDVAAVNCLCTVETRDRDHFAELISALRERKMPVVEK